MLRVDIAIILLEVTIVALFLVWFILIVRILFRCICDHHEHRPNYGSWTSFTENRMYFACCGSKSISRENLHEDANSAPRIRRPNPLIVGLANHLREHHSSSRDSAVAGCFGFPDSPPRYEDIYEQARNVTTDGMNRYNGHHSQGICNLPEEKIVVDEGVQPESEEESPPPSYAESVGMSASTNCLVTIVVQSGND